MNHEDSKRRFFLTKMNDAPFFPQSKLIPMIFWGEKEGSLQKDLEVSPFQKYPFYHTGNNIFLDECLFFVYLRVKYFAFYLNFVIE